MIRFSPQTTLEAMSLRLLSARRQRDQRDAAEILVLEGRWPAREILANIDAAEAYCARLLASDTKVA